jgi:hypothetical protein
MNVAAGTNRTYISVLGMKTPISAPAENAILNNGLNGIIVRFDPATKLFHEFVPRLATIERHIAMNESLGDKTTIKRPA